MTGWRARPLPRGPCPQRGGSTGLPREGGPGSTSRRLPSQGPRADQAVSGPHTTAPPALTSPESASPRPHLPRSQAPMAGCTAGLVSPESGTRIRGGFRTPRTNVSPRRRVLPAPARGACAVGAWPGGRGRVGVARWAWPGGRGLGGGGAGRGRAGRMVPASLCPKARIRGAAARHPASLRPLPTLRVCGSYGWGWGKSGASLRAGFSGRPGKCGSLGVTSPGGGLL